MQMRPLVNLAEVRVLQEMPVPTALVVRQPKSLRKAHGFLGCWAPRQMLQALEMDNKHRRKLPRMMMLLQLL
jgi:hypothetical protein